MGSGAFGAPPSLSFLSPAVWSCAYEFFLLRHCCICLRFMHTTHRDVPTPFFLPPLPFLFLSLQKMGKLQALSNSTHISGAFGMSVHPSLPSYLRIFISKCPIGDASCWLSAVLFLEKPQQLQGLVICCRGPRVLGCVIALVVVHASSLRPFSHCLVQVQLLFMEGICWGWRELLID